jgi:hypothetical protein
MIRNTGLFAATLYGIFILIAIFALVFAYFLIKQGRMESGKIDKLIELFKTVIISCAIGTATLIISNLFKEREQQLSEMKAFSDYLPYITDSLSTMENKLSLCDFMISVAPDGPLREGWTTWLNKLNLKKNEIAAINAKIEKEEVKMSNNPDKPSEQQLAYIQQLEIQKSTLLKDINVKSNSSYLVVIGADKTLSEAEDELGSASNTTIYKRGNWFRTVVPVQTSFEDAKIIANQIANKSNGKKQPYIVSLKSWCSSTYYSESDKCIVCN